ncbi:MAG: GTPase domain-containing protein [Nitrospirae bacterium]|nr:GTPase domain-containing protein [Nitrospirota bacterium]
MALFNYATKEITLKIVYYGPGLSGKTTNLQHLHAVLNPETKGKLLSLSTESDRTLFFDFLPIELGKIREFSIRFQLYTVPGQVRYNATRKVVLKGADAVVFVADSQKDMRDQNIESFENMRENLISNNINPDIIPIILQYNKRDLKNILSVEELNQDLNQNNNYEVLEATAINGGGVEEAFKRITKLVLKDISKKHKIEIQPAEQKKEAVAPAMPVTEAAAEPIKRKIERELEEFEIPAPVSSTGPVIEVDAIEIAEEELEIVPDNEADAIEIAEAELLEPVYEPELMSGSGHTAVTETKSVPPAPVIEEAAPAASVTRWTDILPETPLTEEVPPVVSAQLLTEPFREEPIREDMLRREERPQFDLQPFPTEKIDNLADDLATVSVTLRKVSDAIAVLQKTVSDLKGEVGSIKNEMALLKEPPAKETELKDIKEFRELRREQKEISDLLRDVSDLLGSIKEKKSWFRL